MKSIQTAVLMSALVIGLTGCGANASSAITVSDPAVASSSFDDNSLVPTVFRHEVDGNSVNLLLGFNREVQEIWASSTVANPSRHSLEQTDDGLWELEFGTETSDHDGQLDEYTISLSIIPRRGERHEIQIVRQSPAELDDAYNYEKEDGYSIVAATTLSFPGTDRQISITLPGGYSRLPDEIPAIRVDDDRPDELRRAARIMIWLNGQALTYAPSHPRPAHDSLDSEISALQGGEDGVQCADYRTLFTQLALDYGLQVRWVGLLLFVSSPGLEDATPYSHAAAEIYTESHGWVYVDPWYNLVFQRDGEWLSTHEIRETLFNAPAEIETLRLSQNNTRIARYALGQDAPARTVPVAWPDFDFYRGYFAVIEEITITREED